MDLATHIRESFLNLATAKMRSFLAILCILVGTGSVVALISSGQMATDNALAQFKSLGTNLLSLSIEASEETTTNVQKLNLPDMQALKKASPTIEEIAPYVMTYQPIYFDGNNINGSIVGTTEVLASVVKLEVQEGRFVSFLDQDNTFCVIGDQVAQNLKGSGAFSLLGKQIQLGKNLFTIVGVLKPWQTNLFMFSDLNQSVIIPLESTSLLDSKAAINNILFRVKKDTVLSDVQNLLTLKLEEMLPGQKIDFRSPEKIVEIMAKQRSTFTWLLGMIGGISLIVGGIGVMNIMLVSVIERRREIGVRMAIGAKRHDIRLMFLVESVTLTLFGGVLGVLTGLLISFVLAEIANWEFSFYMLPPLLGFLVSVLVGVLSGFYPAHRASLLDPIESLQSE